MYIYVYILNTYCCRLLLLCLCMFAVVIYAAVIESQASVQLGNYLTKP